MNQPTGMHMRGRSMVFIIGRAELARLILAQADVDYQDHRIEREQWPGMKPGTPMGQLPLLEVDGVVLCQSMTIARYLARRYNLAGKDDIAAAEADQVIDACDDLVTIFSASRKATDESQKAEILKELREKTVPSWLEMMEKLLVSKGGEYFAGGQLTWADLMIFNVQEYLDSKFPEIKITDYKNLNKLVEKVKNLPRIQKWISTRPQTSM